MPVIQDDSDPSVNRRKTTLGIAYVASAGIMLATMDSIGKHLTVRLEVLHVVWARYTFHTALVFLWLALATRRLTFLKSHRPLKQLLRALALLGVTVFMYSALAFVPLADATAVMFFGPVLVTLLSGAFLKESVGALKFASVLAGFVGVVLIVRPGVSTDWHMLLPFGAACSLAVYVLMTRSLSGQDDSSSTIFYSTGVGAVAVSLIVPFHWQPVLLTDLILLVTMGVLGALGHCCIVLGFAYAPASVLSPVMYVQLLAATGLSIVVFGDPLPVTTLAGAVLLVGSGLVIWWRESAIENAASE